MIVPGTPDQWYFYFYDGLGSVVALSNTSGNIVEAYSYDVFGEPKVHAGAGTDTQWFTSDDQIADPTVSALGNPYMFTGRRYDDETGLYYYRARYYKPEIGRFLQPDPIGYYDNMNLYAYVRNNPLNLNDPYGLFKRTVHYKITLGALRSRGFSPQDARIAARASAGVDNNLIFHLKRFGARHSLYGQEKETADIINKWLKEAATKELAGDHVGAMEALGRTLHPVQDRPSHSELRISDNIDHFYRDPDNVIKNKKGLRRAHQLTDELIDEFQYLVNLRGVDEDLIESEEERNGEIKKGSQ